MNIFLIPSWYPSFSAPHAGIFTKEQALLYSKTEFCEKMIVSLWGHVETEIPVRAPWKVVDAFSWYIKNHKPYFYYLSPNFVEIRNAALHWSHRLPFGGWEQLYKKNKQNLLMALEQFGRIDLIHAHVGYPAGVIAQKLSKEFGLPYGITEHMGPFPFRGLESNGVVIPILKRAYHAANGLAAVSSYLANLMQEKDCGTPIVIPNFIDEDCFQTQRVPHEKFTFLTLCSMNEQKGIRCLLHAIYRWQPPAGKVHFIIAGDGAKLSDFKKEAKNLGISDLIDWPGKVDREKVAHLFAQADVFVLPSQLETFGVVCLEAIASGLPIIATRCGGPESIVNQVNGILVDVGDVSQLKEALVRVFESCADFNSIAIRDDFIKRFSKFNAMCQLADFYFDIIRQNKT